MHERCDGGLSSCFGSRKKSSRRRRRRKEVFFHFDWRCPGLLLFLFWNLATTVSFGVIFRFYHVHVRRVRSPSFRIFILLKMFPCQSVMCVSPWDHVFTSPEPRCHSFCLSSIAITPSIRKTAPRKLETLNISTFLLSSPAGSDELVLPSLIPFYLSLALSPSGAVFNDNDNDSGITATGSRKCITRRGFCFASLYPLIYREAFFVRLEQIYYFSFKFYFEQNEAIRERTKNLKRPENSEKMIIWWVFIISTASMAAFSLSLLLFWMQ